MRARYSLFAKHRVISQQHRAQVRPPVRVFGAASFCQYMRTSSSQTSSLHYLAQVRLNDVRLADGRLLQFEVRFGAAAKSQRMPQGSPTGICQVNLQTGSTRVVEAPPAAFAAVGGANTQAAALPPAPPPPVPAATLPPPPPIPTFAPPGTPPDPVAVKAKVAAGDAQADRVARLSEPTPRPDPEPSTTPAGTFDP
jgi:hypothetical protein